MILHRIITLMFILTLRVTVMKIRPPYLKLVNI